MMAQFFVRNVEDDVDQRIRELAFEQGISTEEFVRDILRGVALRADDPDLPFATRMVKLFHGIGLRDGEAIQEPKGEPVRVPSFD